MALTRRSLKAMGIEEDKIEEIIAAHTESTEALKHERDEYKAKAEAKSAEPKPQAEPKPSQGASDEYKAKYDAEKKAFEDYKAEVEAQKAEAAKRGLYRKLIEQAGVDAKRVDAVLKISDLSQVEVKDGAIVDAEKLTDAIKADFKEFIPVVTTEGANVAKPPVSGNGAVTKEQFAKMGIRQRNELFNTDRAAYDALVKAD